jgi:agmatine deiminase
MSASWTRWVHEDAYLAMYGKEKMVWIEESPLIERNGFKIDNIYGQGANGHIDAFMRFVDDDTILVAVMDEAQRDRSPLQAHDYAVLQAGLEQIRAARNSNGEPFEVIEIPVPDVSLHSFPMAVDESSTAWFHQHAPGDSILIVPNMSYANFLITNGAVLVSQYWREGLPESERRKDERMVEILSEQFPVRDIIGLRTTLLLNFNGGGIHCQTQQEPAVGRL